MWVRINTSAFQESAVFSGKGLQKQFPHRIGIAVGTGK